MGVGIFHFFSGEIKILGAGEMAQWLSADCSCRGPGFNSQHHMALRTMFKTGVVADIFNPLTQESEAGRSL